MFLRLDQVHPTVDPHLLTHEEGQEVDIGQAAHLFLVFQLDLIKIGVSKQGKGIWMRTEGLRVDLVLRFMGSRHPPEPEIRTQELPQILELSSVEDV